jgi:hypothetical protein
MRLASSLDLLGQNIYVNGKSRFPLPLNSFKWFLDSKLIFGLNSAENQYQKLDQGENCLLPVLSKSTIIRFCTKMKLNLILLYFYDFNSLTNLERSEKQRDNNYSYLKVYSRENSLMSYSKSGRNVKNFNQLLVL